VTWHYGVAANISELEANVQVRDEAVRNQIAAIREHISSIPAGTNPIKC